MLKQLVPDPLYEHVRDHLEQALAIVPLDPKTDELRASIGEAVDTAIELAYRRRERRAALYVVSNERH
jgi:hypothetical protein